VGDRRPYSTFDRNVDVGLYPKGWAGKVPDLQAAERKESEAWRRKALRFSALRAGQN